MRRNELRAILAALLIPDDDPRDPAELRLRIGLGLADDLLALLKDEGPGNKPEALAGVEETGCSPPPSSTRQDTPVEQPATSGSVEPRRRPQLVCLIKNYGNCGRKDTTDSMPESTGSTIGALSFGPNFTELEEATALLCTKYGASVAFDVEVDPEGRKEIIARMATKQVRVRFHDATGHQREVAVSIGLPCKTMMVCAGFAQS